MRALLQRQLDAGLILVGRMKAARAERERLAALLRELWLALADLLVVTEPVASARVEERFRRALRDAEIRSGRFLSAPLPGDPNGIDEMPTLDSEGTHYS